MPGYRLLIALFASALSFLAAPSAAEAATYDVLSCDATASNVNRSWIFETNDTGHIETGAACGVFADYSGVYTRTKLGSAGAATGAYGQWILRAPAGTTITRMQLSRWLGMEAATGWRLFGRQADGSTIAGEACTAESGSYECNVGGVASAPIDRTLDTTSIAYGFECINVYGCTTGSTLHHARAAVYDSRITISDPTVPTLSGPTGALVSETGYHRGTESASVSASDTTGIKALRVYIDGIERASQTLLCDYTYVVPCSNPSSAQPLSVNLAATSNGTRVIPDGTHAVEVAAVDAAGNETRSTSRSILVDATAPAAPSALASSIGSNWQTSRDFHVTWTHPSGQVAPIESAHWTLCPAGTTTGCATGSAPVSAGPGTLSGLQIPGEGEWNLSVRLQDAAGNTATDNVARTTVRYDATAPAATADLTVSSRRVDTDPTFFAFFNPPTGQSAPISEVLWSLCPQGGSTAACSTGTFAAVPNGTNHFTTSVPSHGDWSYSVRLRDEASNLGPAATTSLRYVASTPAAAPPLSPPPTIAPTPPPTSPGSPSRASARLRASTAVLDRSRRTLTVRGRAATRATGRIRIVVAITRRGRTRTLTAAATLRDGRFGVRLRLTSGQARGRIRVSARYGGTTTHAPDRTRPRTVRLR